MVIMAPSPPRCQPASVEDQFRFFLFGFGDFRLPKPDFFEVGGRIVRKYSFFNALVEAGFDAEAVRVGKPMAERMDKELNW